TAPISCVAARMPTPRQSRIAHLALRIAVSGASSRRKEAAKAAMRRLSLASFGASRSCMLPPLLESPADDLLVARDDGVRRAQHRADDLSHLLAGLRRDLELLAHRLCTIGGIGHGLGEGLAHG